MDRNKILETERLYLRKYKIEDFNALYEIFSDSETMKHYPSVFDEEKTRNWISWNLENYEKYGFGLWAVVLKDTVNQETEFDIEIKEYNIGNENI